MIGKIRDVDRSGIRVAVDGLPEARYEIDQLAIRGLEMSIDMLRDAFLWCAVINYGVLLIHTSASWPLVSIVETAV